MADTLRSLGAPPPPTTEEILADAASRRIPVVDRTVDATADETAAQAAATLDPAPTPVSGTVSVRPASLRNPANTEEPSALGGYSIVSGRTGNPASRPKPPPTDYVAVSKGVSAGIALRVRSSVAAPASSKTASKAPSIPIGKVVPAPKSSK